MLTRSVTTKAEHADEVAKALGGIVIGVTFYNDEKDIIVAIPPSQSTVIAPSFNKLKDEGKIKSWD